MKSIILAISVLLLVVSGIQTKPLKKHKMINNNPMLLEDLFEGDIQLADNVQ